MNASVPTEPARILKRADISAGLARPFVPSAVGAKEIADLAPAPLPRAVAKEARLVSAAAGTAAVDVRCSCGEWTRIELRSGEEKTAEEKR
jgi:hypothetical protein